MKFKVYKPMCQVASKNKYLQFISDLEENEDVSCPTTRSSIFCYVLRKPDL